MKHKNFQKMLVETAKNNGVSLRELARRIGEPEATPGFWARGRNCPSFKQAMAAGVALGLSGDELEIFIDLAAIEHVPDDGARARVLAFYNGLKSAEARLKVLEARVNARGK